MPRVVMLGCGGSAGVPQIGGADGLGDWGACDPAEPRNRRTRSSIVIESGGRRLLVDASPDMRAQFLACGIPAVEAVLFTHAHADHVLGIDDIRILNRLVGRPIDAFATARTMAELDQRFDYAFKPWQPPHFFRPVLTPILAEAGDTIAAAGMHVRLFEQSHGRIPTLGLRVGGFGYSTDAVKLDDAAMAALAGVDTWVVDCFQRQAHTTHANLDQVIAWSRQLRPRRVVLTHMGYDVDWAWLQRRLPPGFEPGFDGLVLDVAGRMTGPDDTFHNMHYVTDSPESQLARLLALMAALRDPRTGCPWDQVQTFDTIAPYTIEEAYEVADAIARRDMAALPDELGDLLFQVVYHARMAQEAGLFAFADVARAITDKMIRRHPHVFPSAEPGPAGWEAQKQAERRTREQHGTLDGIPAGLPALTRALKLTQRAARVGFDWDGADQVLAKLQEEIAEVRAELPEADPARLQDEVGDVLFVVANLARKLGLDPEACLRQANDKFARRFGAVENRLAASGLDPAAAGLAAMEAEWTAVKAQERIPL